MSLLQKHYLAGAILLFMVCGSATATTFPQRASLQQQVEQKYGQPESVKGPVGDPPITQWFYNDFIVVFEYDRVLHAFPRNVAVEYSSNNNSRPATAQ